MNNNEYQTSTEDLSTTDFYVPSNYFAIDTSYTEFLEFSTLDEVSNPPCDSGDPSQCPSLGEIGWTSETETSFTTGVPEPSTWAMMLLGFVGLGFAGSLRAAKSPRARYRDRIRDVIQSVAAQIPDVVGGPFPS
jgi:PEP-CTERM motif-containing protein